MSWKYSFSLLTSIRNNELNEKQQKYRTLGTVSNSMVEAKLTPLTHKYMTAHFPGLIQALQ
jgi:hypothetical protein